MGNERDMKRLTTIFLLIAAIACYTLSAQAQDAEHKWLTYSMEVKMPGVSQDELFDRCGYLALQGDETFKYDCHWDFPNYIKQYYTYGRPISTKNQSYLIDYKIFISCYDGRYLIELEFINAYIGKSWKRRWITKYEYMTIGENGIRGGIAHSTYRHHDKIIRENILPDLFKEICASIKADMMIPRR